MLSSLLQRDFASNSRPAICCLCRFFPEVMSLNVYSSPQQISHVAGIYKISGFPLQFRLQFQFFTHCLLGDTCHFLQSQGNLCVLSQIHLEHFLRYYLFRYSSKWMVYPIVLQCCTLQCFMHEFLSLNTSSIVPVKRVRFLFTGFNLLTPF